MTASKRRVWWTLQWRDGTLDIDGGECMYLYKTKKKAQEAAWGFEDNPVPIKIRIQVSRSRPGFAAEWEP